MSLHNHDIPDETGAVTVADPRVTASGHVGNQRTIRVVVILGASLSLGLILYYGFLGSSWVEFIAVWTATMASKIINLLGGSTIASGTLIQSNDFVANIVIECTGIGPIIIYVSAVVAYPATKRAKIAGAAAGAVVLTAVNLVRIMSLFWIGEAYPEYLNVAHLMVWQSTIILLAIMMWLLWARRLYSAARQ